MDCLVRGEDHAGEGCGRSGHSAKEKIGFRVWRVLREIEETAIVLVLTNSTA